LYSLNVATSSLTAKELQASSMSEIAIQEKKNWTERDGMERETVLSKQDWFSKSRYLLANSNR
jgi:hypothetical protein